MDIKIKGIIANRGLVRGVARIINNANDFDNFCEGDVLVSKNTDPSFVTVIMKAGAIVTDLGGITSHPAIISREFNIPCIVGTKIATQILKDGDGVEVDANQGIVKVLDREAISNKS